MCDSSAASAISSPSLSMPDNIAPARSLTESIVAAIDTSTCCPSPVRLRCCSAANTGDHALQSGVDIRMATRIAARLDQGLAEMIFHHFGVSGFGLNRRREGGTIAPRSGLTITTQ